jgi:hypothetical protein
MKRIALLAALLFTSCQAPTGGWREDVKNSSKKIMSCPPTASARTYGNEVRITVKNHSSKAISYWGRGKDRPMTCSERLVFMRWHDDEWDWCGTGTKQYVLQPGETGEFSQIDVGDTRRVYTTFTSTDGKEEALVQLYSTE